MNHLLASFIGGLLRQALVGVSGYLVARGIFTSQEMENYVAAFITFVLGFGWMLWVKYKDRIKLLSALSLDAPATEAQLETAMAAKPSSVPPASTPKDVTPSSTVSQKLMTVLLAVAIGVGASACATRAGGGNLSPEGTFALRGTAVVNAINGAAPALEALTLPNSCGQRACLTAQEGLEVATKVREGLEDAKQLPGILTTVDKATTAAQQKEGMAKATAVIQQVIQSLNAGLILPSLPEARLKVVLVLQSAQLALIAIGGF